MLGEPWVDGSPAAQPPKVAIQKAMNRPFLGLMNGERLFPGLPSVALGYGWVAHFVGYQKSPASVRPWHIASAEAISAH
jgi:hypothetical protein